MNYKKLISLNPFHLGTIVNSIGQTIDFYEHPIKGDEAPVICVCHSLELAAKSDFYETTDMRAEHKEYEPYFEEGVLSYGYEVKNNLK